MSLERFQRIVMWTLIGFGVGMVIIIFIVDYQNLTSWQEPMTKVVKLYLAVIFIYIFSLYVVPAIWRKLLRK